MPEEQAEIWSKDDILERFDKSSSNELGETIETIVSEFKEFSNTSMGEQLIKNLISNLLGNKKKEKNMSKKKPKGKPKVQDTKKGKIVNEDSNESKDSSKSVDSVESDGINKDTVDKIENWLNSLPEQIKSDMTVKELEDTLSENKEQLLQLIDSGLIDEFMDNYED